MTKISNPSQNVFQRNQAALGRTADQLKSDARELVRDSAGSVLRAGDNANEATAHLAGAAANAVYATGAVLSGTADALEAAGRGGAAGAYASVGAMGWALEGVASAGRFVAANVARGFAGLANAFSGVLKDGQTTTVRELAGDPNAVRFSEKMFGKSAAQLNKAGDAMNASWNSYVNAVSHAAGSAANVVMAAGHTAAVAGNLVIAAGELGAAGVVKLAELGTRAAKVAVEYAEKGVVGARDASILAARISASTANAMAVAGQGNYEVDVSKQIAAFEAELKLLQQAS
ncbi:MAG: hypothetical protein ACO3JL_02665 [Myxococcota bacterium]